MLLLHPCVIRPTSKIAQIVRRCKKRTTFSSVLVPKLEQYLKSVKEAKKTVKQDSLKNDEFAYQNDQKHAKFAQSHLTTLKVFHAGTLTGNI